MNHLTSEQIQRFGERRMSPEELVSADQHLAECADCRATAGHAREAAANRLRQRMRREAERATDHLGALQMEALAHDAVTDEARAVAEAHLATCDACRRELSELKAYVEQLTVTRRTSTAEERWRARDEAARQGPANRASRGLPRKRSWFTPGRRFAFVFAAMLLVAVSVPLVVRGRSGGSTTASVVTAIVHGSVELRDGDLVIAQDEGGPVRGIDALPPAYQDAVRAALDGIRRKPESLRRRPVPGDSVTLAEARATYPRAHLLLGALAQHAGRFDEAEREYRALLGENPGSLAVLRLIGEARPR
jgi:hypothetical protein